MKTTRVANHEKLAIDGGPKALAGIDTRHRPKIGVEEFLSIAERFGFSDEALGRIRWRRREKTRKSFQYAHLSQAFDKHDLFKPVDCHPAGTRANTNEFLIWRDLWLATH